MSLFKLQNACLFANLHQALIDQGVAAVMAEVEASRIVMLNNNGSRPRPAKVVPKECSYSEYTKCNPVTLKALRRSQRLTLWVKGTDVWHYSQTILATSVDSEPGCYLEEQNKRQNTSQAYTTGNSDKKPYARSKPLCSKCNYNHEGPCPPRCNNCKKVGHLAKDCRSRPANANNNNHNNNNNNQKGNGCYECGAQGHFKRNCPKLKNNDRGRTKTGNDRLQRVYVVGYAGSTQTMIVAAIIGYGLVGEYQAVIVCAEKIVRIPWGNETLIIHGDGSNQGNVTRLNIINAPVVTGSLIDWLLPEIEKLSEQLKVQSEQQAL
ncbi:putative reverse transcriptase domain-containing protein [Tanacetum coccineum]